MGNDQTSGEVRTAKKGENRGCAWAQSIDHINSTWKPESAQEKS